MRSLIAIPVLLACLLAPATSFAANPTIFTDQNDGCNVNGCSLREAITATPAGGTITLMPGTYEVSVPGTGENANATGDLDITKSLTIIGAGVTKTTIAQTGLSGSVDGIFDVRAGLQLSDVTVRNGNRANGNGGGFHIGEGTAGQLALTRASLVNNQTNQNGGAISVAGVAGGVRSSASLTDVDLVSNRASDNGGAIATFGDVQLDRTAVRQNAADNGAGVLVDRSSSANRGTLDVVNTTFGNNTSSEDGGAIANRGGLTISFATFSGNQSGTGSSSLYLLEGSSSINNSIITSATDSDCAGPVVTELASGGGNIQSGTTCPLAVGSDLSSTNPKLNALTTVGAPNNVPTFALAPDSPAIDHSGGACSVFDDARGLPRPGGAGCDTGAREEQQTDLTVGITDAPDPVTVGDVLTYTITATNAGQSAAAAVAVTASTPDGTSLVDITSSQGTCSGDTSLRCELGALAPGASATATLRVRPTVPGTIANRTDVSSELTDTNKANNTARASTIVMAPGTGPGATPTPTPTPSATPTPSPTPTPTTKVKLKLSSSGTKSLKVKTTVGAAAKVVLKLTGKGKIGTLVKTKKASVKEGASKTVTLTLSKAVRKRIKALAVGTKLKLTATVTSADDTATSSLTLVVTKAHKLKVR